MKWKDGKLWACGLMYAATVLLLSRFGGWGDPRRSAPWCVLLELLISLIWMVGVYWKWSGHWTQEDNVPWAVLLVLVTLPYIPLVVVGYGTWLCPGGSVVLGIGCIFVKNKCG